MKVKSVSRYCTTKSRVSVVPTLFSGVMSEHALSSSITMSLMDFALKMRLLAARVRNHRPGLIVTRYR